MRFNFEATGLGSVPFKDPVVSCDAVFGSFKQVPFWPQLPKASFLESMYAQFSERMPGIVVDEKKKAVYVDGSRAFSDIEAVYGKYLEGDIDYFKISESYAAGFYEFLRRAGHLASGVKFLKGHITGPVSYALTVTDTEKRSVIYDKDLFEVTAKVLAMKARWQIRLMKKLCANTIIFIDEPYLVSLGSSYVSIDRDSAFARLGEVISAVKEEGALCGLHCCGNTDWPLLLNTDIDIISFDAYNFTKEFLLCIDDVKAFIKRGSTIAWGMIPSSEEIEKESSFGLARRLKETLSFMAEKGIDRQSVSSLVTPSCGVGTLSDDRARRVIDTAREISEGMRA